MPTALIVEDEPEANRLLAMLVQFRNYQTVSALNGAEALASLERFHPDVVFLDLMLPDTNGYEICRAIKGRPETALIPVVIVTARIAEENRTRCFQLGALVYQPKPYTPDQIFKALAQAEQWHRELAERPNEGGYLLDADEDVKGRELSRLSSLLVARTPLPSLEVSRIHRSLRAIGQGATAWAQRTGKHGVAHLEYQITPDGLEVRVEDRSGWFSGGDLTEAAAGYEPGLNEVFDVVDSAPEQGGVRLLRRFERKDTAEG